MHSIKVNRQELLMKVTENRNSHRAVFEEALEGYRAACIKELENMLAEAKLNRRIRRNIELVEPMDQTKDYDRVIAMLKMSVDDIIELDETQFAQYVLDDWRWKGQFSASTMNYMKNK